MKLKKSIKNKSSLSALYKECFRYLSESRKFIWIILMLFALSLFIGYIFPSLFEEAILSLIRDLIARTQNMGFLELMFFIIENNISASLWGLTLGLLLGVPTILITLLNGYVLGYVIQKSVAASGAIVILKLFPHGIFELPAVFISLALGLKLGMFVFKKEKKKYLLENIEKSLKVFVLIIIPLLIIAGFIETLFMLLI